MARLPRYVIPNQPQHIIQRGNNRQVIFVSDTNYQFFCNALVESAKKHGLLIHAYLWMTNHIHMLATPLFEDSISKVFQSVGRKYVQYFNFTYKRSGPLWEGRYRATIVDSELYLLKLMRYIELNPVRANMCEHPSDYPLSSYSFNAEGKTGLNDHWSKDRNGLLLFPFDRPRHPRHERRHPFWFPNKGSALVNDKDWTVEIPNPLIQPPHSQVGTGAEDREVRYLDKSKTTQRQMTGTGLTNAIVESGDFITYDPQRSRDDNVTGKVDMQKYLTWLNDNGYEINMTVQ